VTTCVRGGPGTAREAMATTLSLEAHTRESVLVARKAGNLKFERLMIHRMLSEMAKVDGLMNLLLVLNSYDCLLTQLLRSCQNIEVEML